MPDTREILEERGKTHGWWPDHALITQHIKAVLFFPARTIHGLTATENRGSTGELSHSMREGLEMIAHKLGRITAGDPYEPDHWRDIAGYATLVADELERKAAKAASDEKKVPTPPHRSPGEALREDFYGKIGGIVVVDEVANFAREDFGDTYPDPLEH